ncbi:hybrid sensor histidine kinase/response regulator [Desulfobaculum sp.]
MCAKVSPPKTAQGEWPCLGPGSQRQEACQMVQQLLAATSDAAVLLDERGTVLMSNERLAHMVGTSRSKLKGRNFFSLMNKDAGRFRKAILHQSLRLGEPVEYDDICRPGRVYNARIIPFSDGAGAFRQAVVFFTDITQRQKAEKERIRLATAIEQAAEAMIIMDSDLTIEYVNQAFEAMTGYPAHHMRGQKVDVLYEGTRQKRQLRAILRTVQQGETWTGLCWNTARDGRTFQTEKMISPIRGQRGVVLGYVSVWRDMTQISELERQLRESQKMEAIGTLAGGIAHDFNNILSPIILHAELGLEALPDSHPAHHAFTQILSASRRAAGLVEHILNLSRRKIGKTMPFSLTSLAKECFKLLRPLIPSSIEVILDHSGERDIVLADPAQVHQVIVNLCTNAVQAMPSGGTLRVEVSAVTVSQDAPNGFHALTPGCYALLRVRDTGEGMTPTVLERIYEPFYTTKKAKGSGLGLTVVHNIIAELGGMVRAESTPGRGTVFHVAIPLHDDQAGRNVIDATTAKPQPGRGRVLVVDDEKSVRDSARAALSRLGYHVTTSRSAAEAIARLEQRPDAVDLALIDVTMPGMSGIEMTRRLRVLCPDLPIVLCSGYNDTLTPGKVRRLGAKGFLGKPFSLSDLAHAVAEALGKRRAPRR